MKDQFLISIHQKRSDVPDIYFLTKLVKNFATCYKINPKQEKENEPAIQQYAIEFSDKHEIDLRTDGIIELAEHFLRAFTEYDDIDRFQYFQRVLEYRAENQSPDESFLIIKYQTNLQENFREYFHFLNRFFPLLNILCYIEEVKDGFLLFFEREQDFDDYLFNITSEESLKGMLESKNITISHEFYQRLILVVQNKLMIS